MTETTPSRSPLGRMHRSAIVTAVLICVGVAIAMVAPSGGAFVMPGALTDHHAAIGDDCGQCHVGPDGRTKPFLHGLSDHTAALHEARLCESCHDFGNHALRPHSLPAGRLDAITATIAGPVTPHADPGSEIACSTCHREHQGRAFDLSAVTNERCQSCHAQRFDSFATDHPELGDYPYVRRTRIIFDHGRHRTRHFPESDATFDCEACHTIDPTGRYMETSGFDDACASCHSEQIHGAGRSEPAFVFLQLPGVDVESLEAAGYDIGAWPATAEEMIDFPTSPFVAALLAGDSRYGEWRKDRALLAEVDLYDLEVASDAELAAAARWVAAIRRLVDDFATASIDELRARFRAALGDGAEALVDHLPLAELAKGRHWFGEGGQLSEANPLRDKERRAWGRFPTGVWYEVEEDFAIYYQPTRHLDEFLRLWIDSAARSGATAIRSLLLDEDDRCTKCHSVDRTDENAFVVEWSAFRPPRGAPATRFRHAPHLPVSGEEGCASCHRIAAENEYLASFRAERNVADFVPEFDRMHRDQCLPCHSEERVGGGCVRCHSYHIGDFPLRLPK